MSPRTSVRLRFTSLVLVALLGTWLGHGVEYGLVAGWRGVALGLWGPLHSYMGPLAVLLLLAAFGLSLRLAAVAGAAHRRSTALWRQLRRGVRHDVEPRSSWGSWTETHGIALFLIVAASQVALYLFQENVEAAIAGAPAPGVGALTGPHWSAAFVQGAFAAWLTLGWLVCSRLLRRRTEAIERIEAVLRLIARRRHRSAIHWIPQPVASASGWPSKASAARAPPVASVL